MKKLLGGLVLFLAAVVVLTAILTPLGFWACQVLFPGEVPVRRVFNRCLLITALPLLWPLLKFWQVKGWSQLGWSGRGGLSWREWGRGGLLGAIIMGGLVLLALLIGERGMLPLVSIHWGTKIAGFMAAAVAVGLIEETLFRGAFFLAVLGRLKERVWLWAFFNSVFFATAHFLKAPDPSGGTDFFVGFRIWSEMTWTAWASPEDFARWLTLFSFGMVLCALAYRRGGLGMAAGFHAGVVFIMKLGQQVTTELKPGQGGWFDSDLVTGWAPMLLMWALFFLILFMGKKKGRDERAPC